MIFSNGMIPARFLTLTAHFIILVVLLWDRGAHFRLCFQKYDYTYAIAYQDEYILTLALSLSFLVIELLGFLSGVSMFSVLHGIFSTTCHSVAALLWSVSYIDRWDCTTPYNWYIFIFFSTLPFVSELFVVMRCFRRYLRQ